MNVGVREINVVNIVVFKNKVREINLNRVNSEKVIDQVANDKIRVVINKIIEVINYKNQVGKENIEGENNIQEAIFKNKVQEKIKVQLSDKNEEQDQIKVQEKLDIQLYNKKDENRVDQNIGENQAILITKPIKIEN